jgi:hypothetical protein
VQAEARGDSPRFAETMRALKLDLADNEGRAAVTQAIAPNETLPPYVAERARELGGIDRLRRFQDVMRSRKLRPSNLTEVRMAEADIFAASTIANATTQLEALHVIMRREASPLHDAAAWLRASRLLLQERPDLCGDSTVLILRERIDAAADRALRCAEPAQAPDDDPRTRFERIVAAEAERQGVPIPDGHSTQSEREAYRTLVARLATKHRDLLTPGGV